MLWYVLNMIENIILLELCEQGILREKNYFNDYVVNSSTEVLGKKISIKIVHYY